MENRLYNQYLTSICPWLCTLILLVANKYYSNCVQGNAFLKYQTCALDYFSFTYLFSFENLNYKTNLCSTAKMKVSSSSKYYDVFVIRGGFDQISVYNDNRNTI